MSQCPGCGAYDGMHWHDCKQYPVEQWSGVIGPIRQMTREEIEKEYPGAQPAAADSCSKEKP